VDEDLVVPPAVGVAVLEAGEAAVLAVDEVVGLAAEGGL
jgi:hypothetical protein